MRVFVKLWIHTGSVHAAIVGWFTALTVLISGPDIVARAAFDGLGGPPAPLWFFVTVDLLVALAVALFRSRDVEAASTYLVERCKYLGPVAAREIVTSVLVQVIVVAVSGAILATRPVPLTFSMMLSGVGIDRYASAAWPGAMSVFVAAFGASAHATVLARSSLKGT
jgi:hypothetical protein